MPRTLPREVKVHVDKARESALLAVEIYNKPLTTFRSGGYVTLMCIAWTALFHAVFFRRNVKPFYHDCRRPRLYQKVDGDYKAWELSTCVSEFYGDKTPGPRTNLEFIVGLRNKIEHRSIPALDVRIFGECQALLFNFEDCLVEHFGRRYALNESLSLALQFSQLRDSQQSTAVQTLHRSVATNIDQYVRRFRSSLTADQLGDLQYSYKVFLIPRTSNHHSVDDLAVQFIHMSDLTEESAADLASAVALIKPVTQQVANAGRFKPSEVCARMLPTIQQYVDPSAKFTPSGHHARAWRFYEVRPPDGNSEPKNTKIRYCQYDVAHKDYVYTEEWVAFLTNEMKKPGQYEKVTGWHGSVAPCEPKPTPQLQVDVEAAIESASEALATNTDGGIEEDLVLSNSAHQSHARRK